MTTTPAAFDPFTPTTVRRIIDAIPGMTDPDLAAYRARADRITANYRGVPTPDAHAAVTRADTVAAAVDAERAARAATTHRVITDARVGTFDGALDVGRALGSLGFGDLEYIAPTGYTPGHNVTYADGRRIRVITTDARVGGGLESVDVAVAGSGRGASWGVSFPANTPAAVVIATIATAVGAMTPYAEPTTVDPVSCTCHGCRTGNGCIGEGSPIWTDAEPTTPTRSTSDVGTIGGPDGTDPVHVP